MQMTIIGIKNINIYVSRETQMARLIFSSGTKFAEEITKHYYPTNLDSHFMLVLQEVCCAVLTVLWKFCVK